MIVEGEEVFFPEKRDGKEFLVYVPLRGYLIQAHPQISEELQNPSSEVRKLFIKKIKARKYIDPHKTLTDLHRSVPGLSIPITDDCNLRCRYCYCSAGEEAKSLTMSYEQIQLCVDTYFSRLDNYSIWEDGNFLGVSIAGGGEPTYKFSQMKFAIDYVTKKCGERNLTPRFSMPTNGVYGDDIRQFIVEHFAHVSLSLDGPKFIHDKQRPTKNGRGSFDTVFETGKYFLDAGMSFTIRSTVSKFSLPYIEDMLDFFDKEFPGIKVGLEPLDYLGRAVSGDDEVLPPDVDDFAIRLTEAYEHAGRSGITVRNSAVGHFELLTPFFCRNACGPGWVFTADGRIIACTRDPEGDHFCFGKYDASSNTYVIDEDSIANLRAQNVMSYPECSDCFMKYNCGGDCPHKRQLNMRQCETTRQVGLFVLRQKLGLEG